LSKLPAYNAAARQLPWFALVDLDNWQGCVGDYVAARLGPGNPGMRFRVAVRAVEAWLLADGERLSHFLAVASSRLPADPDQLPNPKLAMVNLARHSRSQSIRQDMVPKESTGAVVGPLYSARLRAFASTTWSPAEAALRSASLTRCLRAVATLADFAPGR
jgi:hypothetical protein